MSGHHCNGAKPGDYTGQVELVAPPFMARQDGRGICVDVCLALEIMQLWRQGIATTGCCCGHGEAEPFIGVRPEHIEEMKALGYHVHRNPGRPDDEDSFTPKTVLERIP